ncbi:putative reverse transcriptase zinc-binding domain-containing protein [Arabidopsis thaliana]
MFVKPTISSDHPGPPSVSLCEDVYGWFVDVIKCMGFSSAKTWYVRRPSNLVKDWHNVVWFKGSTPKHAFLFWISHLDELLTRSQLVSWGLMIPISCCLYNGPYDTRDRLKLACPLRLVIWHFAQRRLGMMPRKFGFWVDLITWAKGTSYHKDLQLSSGSWLCMRL